MEVEQEEDPEVSPMDLGDPVMIEDLSDLPSSLIVTGLPLSIFSSPNEKADFEIMFARESGCNWDRMTFFYFKSFKRVRVTFETPQDATIARVNCDSLLFNDCTINCFFAQAQIEEDIIGGGEGNLGLPSLEKQFLISPPASPPTGWEQTKESEPVINLDLIARLAAMAPRAEGVTSVSHEIHPGSEIAPSIFLHTCEDDGDSDEEYTFKLKPPGAIPHTPCPPRPTTT